MVFIGRYIFGPNNTFVVVADLYDSSHHPSGADAVATHNHILFLAILVFEFQIKRLGVFSAEFKNIANLNRFSFFKTNAAASWTGFGLVFYFFIDR